MVNYYELLDLKMNSTREVIVKHLHNKQREWVARTNSPNMETRHKAERMVQMLADAESILLDKTKRAEYDNALHDYLNRQKHKTKDTSPPYQSQEQEKSGSNRLQAERFTKEAILLARKAIQFGWYVLGRAHHLWGDLDDAIAMYEQAIVLVPGDDSSIYHLSLAHFEHLKKEFSEKIRWAEHYSNRAMVLRPNDPFYQVYAAEITHKKGDLDTAIEMLNQLVKQSDWSTWDEETQEYFKASAMYLYYEKAMQYWYKNPDNGKLYLIEGDDARISLKYLQFAKKYCVSDDAQKEIEDKIKRSQDALTYTFDIYKLHLFIIPSIVALSSIGYVLFKLFSFELLDAINGMFFSSTPLGVCYVMYRFCRVPQWRLTRKALFGNRHAS